MIYHPATALLVLVFLFADCCYSCRPNPVDCSVSEWTQWSQCTKTCSRGDQNRNRSITNYPEHEGKMCPSNLKESRNCNTMLCPIDCLWGSWSLWGNCPNTSQNFKTRVRTIERPAMFGGKPCDASDSEFEACHTHVAPNIQCGTNEILCKDGLTCVRKDLLCNGDDDCADNFDELNCNAVVSPCQETLDDISNIDIAGAGFDIVDKQENGMILDNLRYDGRCIKVASGNGNLRLPANLQFYRFQSQVNQGLKVRSYQSEAHFFQETKQEVRNNFEPKVEFSYESILDLSIAVAVSSVQEQRTIVRQSTKGNSTYFKIGNVIQVASFRTVRENLILSRAFRKRVAELPDHYDYVHYAQFIDDFGTHYYSSGVLGGKWEIIYRYDSNELQHSGLSEAEQKECFKLDAAVSVLGIKIINISPSTCSSNKFVSENGGTFISAAKDFTQYVKGGSSNTHDYNSWVETVKDNLAVIDYKLTPISAVFESFEKRANMESALYKYLKRFDPKNCLESCENGGSQIVVNRGKECICLCRPGYVGISCSEKY